MKPAQKIIFLIIPLIMQFLFGLEGLSFAVSSTIFVDDGNSSGNEFGTATNPFNTIQEGIDAAATGSTIDVAGGSYLDIFLTEDNSNITIVGGSNVEIKTGLTAAGLSTNKLKNVSIKSFKFSGGYSDIFIINAESVTVSNSEVKEGFQGLTLIDVKDSIIKNSIFSQNWINLVLSGDLSNTEIEFNDFIPADQGIQLDASELNTPQTIKIPYNWWGSPDQPPSLDKVDRNKWLIASKDSGKPGSGYSYSGDNGKVKISGGDGSTATIYVGKYRDTLEDGIEPMSGNLKAVSPYYDIVSEGETITWPIKLTINYQQSDLPAGLAETAIKGLYFFKQGEWKLYGADPVDDPVDCRSNTSVDTLNNIITADVCHLTAIAAGGELNTPTPTPTSTSNTTAVTSSASSVSSQAETNTANEQVLTDLQAASINEIVNPILDFLEVEPENILEEFVSEGEVLGQKAGEKTAIQSKEAKTFPLKELLILFISISIFSYFLKLKHTFR